MKNLILCGGSGTRLWPMSRVLLPKQFVKIFEGQSLFQKTVERNFQSCDEFFVISNAEQYFLAKDQLTELKKEKSAQYLLEPVGRNTAPAIALACLKLNKDDVVLVTPSDQLIVNQSAYEQVLKEAEKFAQAGNLVTFGIQPTSPETGFGYIQANGNQVEQFCEKPDLETAKSYIAQGNFYWNSGMFCFKAGVFLDELSKFEPEMLKACESALEKAQIDETLNRISHEDMMEIPANSIDYAVMEKSKNVRVVPADIGWSDLGSFQSLFEELPQSDQKNTENKKHISHDSNGNLIIGSERLIATVGLKNHMVIDTPDALLVGPLSSSQDVKQIVEQLKNSGSDLHRSHANTTRPWGSYTVLRQGTGYKVKRITVRPGNRLSLQMHHHRNEHWIILNGTAKITVGDKVFLLRPNESTYIPMGQKHRLENPGKVELEMVEVQVGSYLEEDDIVRFEDDYKRSL